MTQLEELAEKAYLEAEIACARANRKRATKADRLRAESKLQLWHIARLRVEQEDSIAELNGKEGFENG